jgi:DNA-binding SARP family transcriptional activator/WD40 repeat protein
MTGRIDPRRGVSDVVGSRDATDVVRVLVLGPLAVEYNGRPLHVAGSHRRRLLACLASRAGRVVSVDAIVGALWGEDPPATATRTIQSHVARLRRSFAAVDGELIETAAGGGYRLTLDPAAVDATEFERLADTGRRLLAAGDFANAVTVLAEALSLWRGQAYDEFAGAEFAAAEAIRLDELRWAATEDAAEARLESGALESVIPDLERLVAEQPGRERTWGLLMRALYAAARQHDALVAFQRARRALADGFGLEPGPELRALERHVLEQDPGLSVRRRPTLPAELRRDQNTFVGRDRELAWLADGWRIARRGSGQLLALLGPVDSGRTRLAAELAAVAIADGGQVIYVRGADGFDRPLLLDPGDAPTAGAIVDVVSGRAQVRPLLLVVDDAEWCSATTAATISTLAGAIEHVAVMLFVIADPSGSGPAIQALHRLDRSGGRTLVLDPMPDDVLARIVTADAVDGDGVAGVLAIADGLPGLARREAAAWAERVASDRLTAAAASSIGATATAVEARASVFDDVLALVAARARRDELVSSTWVGRQPYRALSAYGPEDADLFVGRERLVAELAARVLDRRLVAVIGASGSGKSSLVRAGLVPLVRSGRLPGTGPWRTNVIVPGLDPLAVLDAVEGLDEPEPQLLVVDQLEELFSTGAADAYAGRLVDLVLDTALDVHVVVVMRADQYGALAATRLLAEMVEDAQVVVGPPSDVELRRIIEVPARRTGCLVDPALVDLIADDVAGYDAALPLVSAALADVWEGRHDNTLTADHYEAIGGLAAAVERLGTRAVGQVGDDESIRHVMLRLVDVTDDGQWVRRRLRRDEIPAELAPAVDALVDARLVRRDDQQIDVVHEVVFRAWPLLTTWLADARTDLVLDRELRTAARAWDTQGRSDDDVYRGARLAAAAEFTARRDDVDAPVPEFIAAGQRLAEREHDDVRRRLVHETRARRRLSRALVAAAVLLVGSLAGGSLALVNQRRAEQEERESALRALVSDSVALRTNDRDLAALLAVEAYRLAPGPDTEAALFGTFTAAPGIGPTIRWNERVGGVGLFLLPDGETIATTDAHARIRLVDVATGQQRTLSDDGLAEEVAGTYMSPSSDGRYIAIAVDGTDQEDEHNGLMVLDLETGQRRFPMVALPFLPGSVAINADGSLVAVGGGIDARIQVYDGATGSLLHDVEPIPRPDDATFHRNTVAVLFAPDGPLIVSSQAGPIRFIDATTGRELRRFDSIRETAEGGLVLSPDEGSLLTSGARGMMLYDPASGAPKWRAPTEVTCDGIAYAERLGAILCSADGGRVVAVDLATGAIVRGRFDSQRGGAGLLVTPDGTTLLEFSPDGAYTRWRLDGGGLVSRVLPVDGHVIDYTTDGETLLINTEDPTEQGMRPVVEIVDVDTGEVVDRLLDAVDAKPTSDPNRLAVHFDDGTINWYDLSARTKVGEGVRPDFDIQDMIVIDDKVLAWPLDGPLSILDPAAGTVTPIGDPEAKVWQAYTFGPDQLLTIPTDFSGITRRDRSNGAVLAQFALPTDICCITATGDDVIVANGGTGDLVVLDPATLQPAGPPFPPTRGYSAAAALSADEQRLLLLGADSSLHFYNIVSRTQLGDEIDLGIAEGAALRDDGLQAAAASEHGIVIWDLDPEHWADAACELAGRNLTPDEWDQYLGVLGDYRNTCPEHR